MPNSIINEESIDKLKYHLELSVNRKIIASKDFQYLTSSIYERCNQTISISTLKRLFGAVEYQNNPSLHTLDTLSKFIGFSSFADFVEKKDSRRKITSFSYSSKLIRSKDLAKGDRLVVTWKPDRYCIFKYLGDNTFEVVKSVNSKLKVHATFSCSIFAEKLCAMLTNYHYENGYMSSYVIGYNGGLTNIRIESGKGRKTSVTS